MKTMRKQFILIVLIAFFSIIPLVNAQDPDVDLSGLPQAFADALGITLFAGQLLASTIFVSLFVFPTLYLTNKRANQGLASLVVGLLAILVCVGFGWLDIFIIILLSLITASLFAIKMKNVFT